MYSPYLSTRGRYVNWREQAMLKNFHKLYRCHCFKKWSMDFPGGPLVRIPPASSRNARDLGWIPEWEDPLE